MSDLLGRQVIVQLNDESLEGFRVSFEVTKTIDGTPNKATIRVYNIARERIDVDLIRKRDLRVRLFVGYDAPALVFEGHPLPRGGVEWPKDGPDTVLKIMAQDGFRRYQRGRVDISFSSETTAQQLVDEAAKQLGIPAGSVKVDEDVRWTQGISFSGPASELLDRVARATGSDWSSQDGDLQMLPAARTRRDRGPLYSRELGNLIDVQPTKNGIKSIVLLDGAAKPGDLFRVEDRWLGGDYKAGAITHKGDSGFDAQFYSTIEGREYSTDPPPPPEDDVEEPGKQGADEDFN